MRKNDNNNLPVFNITELKWDTETEEIHDISIEQKTIQGLGEIVAIADRHSVNVNIKECVLTEVQIDSANIDIFFNKSVFKEKIRLKGGVFDGKLNFWDSTFEEETDFSGAIFKEDIKFEYCTFHKKVNLFEATLGKSAAFISCDFKGEVAFDGVSFKGEVDFSESTFRKKAVYNRAIFKKAVDLSGTLFEESLEITGSNLPEMFQKKMRQTAQFNLSHEADGALKKKFSRRQILRGLFRFLPEDKEK